MNYWMINQELVRDNISASCENYVLQGIFDFSLPLSVPNIPFVAVRLFGSKKRTYIGSE